jgi:hypothetical protein
VIEVTDEMERAMYGALACAEPGQHHAAVRTGLAAVLAVAERDSDGRYERLLAANRKLVGRLHALEAIEDDRDRALGQLEDACRRIKQLEKRATSPNPSEAREGR